MQRQKSVLNASAKPFVPRSQNALKGQRSGRAPRPPRQPKVDPNFKLSRLNNLSECEIILKRQIDSISETIINAHTAAIEKKACKNNSERKFFAAIKPLFKEWLEIRDLYHDLLGPYLHLPGGTADKLLTRTHNLRKYLREIHPPGKAVPGDITPEVVEHLKEFYTWLKVSRCKVNEN